MSKKLLFGFITDPLDSFNRKAETTLFLMREIFSRGHKVFVCEPKDIFLKQNDVWAKVQHIELTGHPHCFYRIVRQFPFRLSKLDCLFLRKDPPFDLNYLFHLWMLLPLEKKVRMINPPSAILKHNEKLSALQFPFAPKTWVGSDLAGLKEWAKQFKEGVVIKPLNSSGGRDVYWVKKSEKFKVKSKKFPILAQEFLPEVKYGDKRVLLWNGRILGAFLRRPTRKGEFRANLHLGGKFEACRLTPKEKERVKKVAAWCKREKLYFVGLDMIGSKITEINVTSTMGIRELDELYKVTTEKTIIDSIFDL